MSTKDENIDKDSNDTIHCVSGSLFKPLSVGFLNKIKEDVYKEQFFDYEETIDADEVLKALQNLKENPTLLDYVLKCLKEQKLLTPKYAVTVNIETIPEYNEKIHQTFEKYNEFVIEGDFGRRRKNVLIKKVFNGIDEVEKFIKNYKQGESIISIDECRFEKYTINEIGAVAV
jgi:hypothetical protein